MHEGSGVDTLDLFNEKADKLASLRFTKELENSGLNISAKYGQPLQAERYGPDVESIDAFLLTMRFFVQDSDLISFKKMSDLYSELPVDTELKNKFNEARTKTNRDLDKASMVIVNKVELTYRYIYEIFLWGGLAHANPKKKAIYDKWVQNQVLFAMLQHEFVYALKIILNMIFFTREINNVALGQLASNS